MKQNEVVCCPGPVPLFFLFWFEYLVSGLKSYRDFREGCNLSTLLYRQRMWFLLRTNWVAQFPHIVTLTQQQLVKVEVEVCQTLLTCLRVQGFPAYVFHRTLPINAIIIDSVLFCHKTYSSLAKNLTLGRANGRKMTIAFYFFCSLNGTQVQMNLRGFLISK